MTMSTTMITARIAVATGLLAAVSWGVWRLLESLLGHSLLAQIVAVLVAGGVGGAVYIRAVLAMRIPEARQVRSLVLDRFGRA